MALTGSFPRSRGGTGPRAWMAEGQEGWLGQSAERSAADGQSANSAGAPAGGAVPAWYSLAPVGVVWSVCQLEALLHPSLSLLDVCCRLFLVCLLWLILGCCVYTLKSRLRPGRSQEPPGSTPPEVQAESRNKEHSWASQGGPGVHPPLAVALADSLLLCVLQEALPDPRVPHIKALISRLESVSDTLGRAGIAAGVRLEGGGAALTDRLELVCSFLQQRTASLHALVQAQGQFQASVADMLQGLDGLWARLEDLHTGVTLSKEGSRGRVAVASAQTDTETLFSVLGRYRTKLQSCEAHLKDSTRLLQELTWSHAHVSNTVSAGAESVWPEALLQSNIEQFDSVQECFTAVEQQTSTFQAHLEGLGKANQRAHNKLTRSTSVPHQTAPPHHNRLANDDSLERRNSTSSSRPSADHTGSEAPPSLYTRSALRISSTLDCLRRSGRKK